MPRKRCARFGKAGNKIEMSHGKIIKARKNKTMQFKCLTSGLRNSPQASCLGNDVRALVKPGTK